MPHEINSKRWCNRRCLFQKIWLESETSPRIFGSTVCSMSLARILMQKQQLLNHHLPHPQPPPAGLQCQNKHSAIRNKPTGLSNPDMFHVQPDMSSTTLYRESTVYQSLQMICSSIPRTAIRTSFIIERLSKCRAHKRKHGPS